MSLFWITGLSYDSTGLYMAVADSFNFNIYLVDVSNPSYPVIVDSPELIALIVRITSDNKNVFALISDFDDFSLNLSAYNYFPMDQLLGSVNLGYDQSINEMILSQNNNFLYLVYSYGTVLIYDVSVLGTFTQIQEVTSSKGGFYWAYLNTSLDVVCITESKFNSTQKTDLGIEANFFDFQCYDNQQETPQVFLQFNANVKDGQNDFSYIIKQISYLSNNEYIIFADEKGSLGVINIKDKQNPFLVNLFKDPLILEQDPIELGSYIVTFLDDTLALVTYLNLKFFSLFDISDIENPVFKQRYYITQKYYNLIFNKKTNMLILGYLEGFSIIEINVEQAVYVQEKSFKLGYENNLTMYPLRVIDSTNFICSIPLKPKYKITTVDTYSIEQDFYWSNKNLPSIYDIYQNDSIIGINPQNSGDINEQFIHVVISNYVSQDVFVGIKLDSTTTIDSAKSKEIFFGLIKVGYMDFSGYLTSNFDKQQTLWLEAEFTGIEIEIRNKLSNYVHDLSFQISIIGSLSIDPNNEINKLQVNTPSTQSIIVTIKLENSTLQTNEKVYFMTNKVYTNVISTFSIDKTQIQLTGLPDNVNLVLQQLYVTQIYNTNPNTQSVVLRELNLVEFKGTIQITDNINEKYVQVIENIGQYLDFNNEPLISNKNLQEQFDSQVLNPQVFQELFFAPILDIFSDPDGDAITFQIWYMLISQNSMGDATNEKSEWQILDQDNWLSFNTNNQQFKGTPTQDYLDKFMVVRMYAYDQYRSSDYDEFIIDLYDITPQFNQNLQKQFGVNEAVITEQFEYQIKVIDSDSTEILYNIKEILVNGASELQSERWLSLDQNTGVLSGIPPTEMLGFEYEILIVISDSLKSAEDTLKFTIKDTIFNTLYTIIQYLLIAISVIGFIQYRDEFYNIFFKHTFRFPKDILVAGQTYKKEIPLVKEVLKDSNAIFKKIKKQSKIKNDEKWINDYFDQKTKIFKSNEFEKVIEECYLEYIREKLYNNEIKDLVPFEIEQLEFLIRDVQIVLGLKDYEDDEKIQYAFYYDYLKYLELQYEQTNSQQNQEEDQIRMPQFSSDFPKKKNISQYMKGSTDISSSTSIIRKNIISKILLNKKKHISNSTSQMRFQDIVKQKQTQIKTERQQQQNTDENNQQNGNSSPLTKRLTQFQNSQSPTNSDNYNISQRKSKGFSNSIKKKKNEKHQLIHSQNCSNILIMYLNYQIVQNLSQKSIAVEIIKCMKHNTKTEFEFQSKAGWVQKYFEYENKQKLKETYFQQHFDQFYQEIQDKISQKKIKFSDFELNKKKKQVYNQCLLLIIAEANGISYGLNFFKNIFRSFLVPSRGLCINTVYSNIQNANCMVFDDTTFIVKHFRWLSAYFNLNLYPYPTPDNMPTWLSQDIDIVNNVLIIQGTPTSEDINQEFLLRIMDNTQYIIRQYVLQVIAPTQIYEDAVIEKEVVKQNQLHQKSNDNKQTQIDNSNNNLSKINLNNVTPSLKIVTDRKDKKNSFHLIKEITKDDDIGTERAIKKNQNIENLKIYNESGKINTIVSSKSQFDTDTMQDLEISLENSQKKKNNITIEKQNYNTKPIDKSVQQIRDFNNNSSKQLQDYGSSGVIIQMVDHKYYNNEYLNDHLISNLNSKQESARQNLNNQSNDNQSYEVNKLQRDLGQLNFNVNYYNSNGNSPMQNQ